VVAIGETGLDYYRMPSQQPGGTAADDDAFKRKQASIFTQQLEVAAEAGLNVVIHQRGDVLEETLEMLRPFKGKLRPQFHCFNGDENALGQVLELGGVVSYTGIVTFKNAGNVRDVLRATPMGSFMLETDCPFLAPIPHRGKRCEPAYVKQIAEVVAEVKGCSLEELSEATCRTAKEFFPRLDF
jgi:TatD DNase family protein